MKNDRGQGRPDKRWRRRAQGPSSVPRIDALARELDDLAAETGFSGVVRIDQGDELVAERAYGFADLRWEIPNEVDTRFGIASGTKGLTALAVMSLVDAGVLALETPAREHLRDDLPLVGDDVTVEHLLAHTSGIGDYFDEEEHADVDAYVLDVAPHELATTEDYLRVLAGRPAKSPPGERFAYSNSGYVVLALIAERASGVPFHDLVAQRVCAPAGMTDTGFFRSDELPARTAVGYIDAEGAWRTNALHLPVRGSGDGGIYSTAADVRALWRAFVAGEIVARELGAEMVRPRSEAPPARYGLGFWLDGSNDDVLLEGSDAGVSFHTRHDPVQDVTRTVVSNTSRGAWPLVRYLGTVQL